MSRPIKTGLDYFPHDTNAVGDDKLQSLMALCGPEGYAFYFILLERIYQRENGSYPVGKLIEKAGISRVIGITVARFEEILQRALEVGCFDPAVYESTGCLTSAGIQSRLFHVNELRRKEREKKQKLILIHKEKDKEKVKAKPGKTKVIPGENSNHPPLKKKFLRYVYLSDAEFEKLMEKLNGQRESYIERLDGYIGQIGEKKAATQYKSHYDTILNWKRRDDAERKGPSHLTRPRSMPSGEEEWRN